VVEDDAVTAMALRTILRRSGWEVEVAATVAEAMRLLHNSPSAIVLDLMLPDGDGAMILEFVRKSKAAIRVAVTTGASDPDRLARLAELSPDLVLRKPIDLGALLRGLNPSG
jgi:DNA-binding response OmpR family regulator